MNDHTLMSLPFTQYNAPNVPAIPVGIPSISSIDPKRLEYIAPASVYSTDSNSISDGGYDNERSQGPVLPMNFIVEGGSSSNANRSKSKNKHRLNKFVRRLHEMLVNEQDSGVVEWRKGLLILHSTTVFTKKYLPMYFYTRNFKTFRRQLNYYGFVHVRSYTTSSLSPTSSTTALWVNQELAEHGTDDISSILSLRRVDPSCRSPETKTSEGRRVRKEEAILSVVSKDFVTSIPITTKHKNETTCALAYKELLLNSFVEQQEDDVASSLSSSSEMLNECKLQSFSLSENSINETDSSHYHGAFSGKPDRTNNVIFQASETIDFSSIPNTDAAKLLLSLSK